MQFGKNFCKISSNNERFCKLWVFSISSVVIALNHTQRRIPWIRKSNPNCIESYLYGLYWCILWFTDIELI